MQLKYFRLKFTSIAEELITIQILDSVFTLVQNTQYEILKCRLYKLRTYNV